MVWLGHYWIYQIKSVRGKQRDMAQTSSERLYKEHSYFARPNQRRSIDMNAVSLLGQSDKGFYGPHSRCVYQSMQSLQRCQPIAPQPIAPLTDHELNSEAGLNAMIHHWTPNSIQKSNTTYDVLKTRRRYQNARQQQLWSMSSGRCGIFHSVAPRTTFKVSVNELRAHMDSVKEELYSKEYTDPEAR